MFLESRKKIYAYYFVCRRGRHLNTAAVVVTPCIGCTAQLHITELGLTTPPAHRTATRHRGLGHSARRPTGRPDLGPGHVPRAAGNRRRLHQSQAGAVTRSRRAGTAAGRPPRPAGRQQPNTRGGRRHPLHSSSLQLQSPSPTFFLAQMETLGTRNNSSLQGNEYVVPASVKTNSENT